MTKAEKQALKDFEEWLEARMSSHNANENLIRFLEAREIREQFKKLFK